MLSWQRTSLRWVFQSCVLALTSCRYHPQPCTHCHLSLFCKKNGEDPVEKNTSKNTIQSSTYTHNHAEREREREREKHTGEDEWSRRQSKSNLSWDTHFWGPHEGPSSQQLLCFYLLLLLFLSPPSLSLFLSHYTPFFVSHHPHPLFHFTIQQTPFFHFHLLYLTTTTVWNNSLFFSFSLHFVLKIVLFLSLSVRELFVCH